MYTTETLWKITNKTIPRTVATLWWQSCIIMQASRSNATTSLSGQLSWWPSDWPSVGEARSTVVGEWPCGQHQSDQLTVCDMRGCVCGCGESAFEWSSQMVAHWCSYFHPILPQHTHTFTHTHTHTQSVLKRTGPFRDFLLYRLKISSPFLTWSVIMKALKCKALGALISYTVASWSILVCQYIIPTTL